MNNQNHRMSIGPRLGIWALLVSGVLMVPFFSNAPWTGMDYVFAGVVLFGAAAVYEVIGASLPETKPRIALGAGVLLVVLMIWAWAVA